MNSLSGRTQNLFCFEPLIYIIRPLPQLQLSRNPVYELLLFPRPSEGGATLVVELDDNLFEAVDGVEFDIVAYNLVHAGGYVSVVDMHIRSRRRPTSKSAQVSELAIGRLLLPP